MNLCELYTDVITAIHVGIAIGSKYWLRSAAALETAEEMTRKFFRGNLIASILRQKCTLIDFP